MNKTAIEYLDYTWNPLAMLCTPISESCENCWHRKRARLLSFNPKISDLERKAYAGLVKPRLIKDRLKDPFTVKKPSIIGVQFMGDLFHEDVPLLWIHDIFNLIVKAYWHTFLILTKRPERIPKGIDYTNYLPNAWLGVTAENQDRADERIPILLQIPAAKRFVSIEPMLGPVDLDLAEYQIKYDSMEHRYVDTYTTGNLLNWVIVGGESGPGARPMHPDWVRYVRDQCQEAGVPFFFKQWGEWISDDFSTVLPSGRTPKRCSVHVNTGETFEHSYPYNAIDMMRIGRKAAGRLLDGREWNERPD